MFEALDLLAAEDGRKAALVRLRYFGGLFVKDAVHCLRTSCSTADR